MRPGRLYLASKTLGTVIMKYCVHQWRSKKSHRGYLSNPGTISGCIGLACDHLFHSYIWRTPSQRRPNFEKSLLLATVNFALPGAHQAQGALCGRAGLVVKIFQRDDRLQALLSC